MTAKEQHDLYMMAMESLSEEDMKKMIEENSMIPALLIDIGRSLAILADAVGGMANKMKGGTDEEAGERY